MDDEWLDLVDPQDNVTGKMLRSEVYAKGLHNFRVVNGFLKNAKGELWIPRRTAHKKLFPLALDMSVAGHVESGETYAQSLLRETEEELGIKVPLASWKYLGQITPAQGAGAFEAVYELTVETAPKFNRDDFFEYFWLKPEQVIERLAQGDKAKPDLPVLIKHFYL